MFSPDVTKVLESVRKILRKDGRIVLAVHGISEKVPYFSGIMNPILKHIPDIRPEGTFYSTQIWRSKNTEKNFWRQDFWIFL
jgi:hypothetical protein